MWSAVMAIDSLSVLGIRVGMLAGPYRICDANDRECVKCVDILRYA